LYRICFGITLCGFVGFFLLRQSFRTLGSHAGTQSAQKTI
jgi:PPP family 3-phenylpropionic acid transporter